jgi:Integrase core domain
MFSDEEILKIYKDPNFFASFGGVRQFRDALFAEFQENVPLQRLTKILQTDENYLLHMKPRRKFPVRHYDVKSFGSLVQMDLAFMPKYQGFSYFLLLIDVFSRHIYCEALKEKSAGQIKVAFEKIYENFQSPIYKLESDQGTEFIGNKKYFKSKNIYFHTKVQKHKASFAEHAIYLVKIKLYKILRNELSQDWVHYLPIVVKSLNDHPVKSLGNVAPGTINTFLDDVKVRAAQSENKVESYSEPDYKTQNKNQATYEASSSKFQVGAYVYLDFKQTAFDKSFDTQISLFLLFILLCCFVVQL